MEPYNITMKLRKKGKPILCARCDQTFSSWNSLRNHSKTHLQKLKEINLLQQGKLPDETKEGRGFKGKNKIIVA